MTLSRSSFKRLAEICMLFAALLVNSRASAQTDCPAPEEASGGDSEKVLSWRGRKVSARACYLWIGDVGYIQLEVRSEGLPLVRNRLPASRDIEGGLRSLRFDDAHFALSAASDGLTIPLILVSRLSWTAVEDNFEYIWLYQFDGGRLQRVFDTSVRESHGDCRDEKSCSDPSFSRSIIIVQPSGGRNGLRDIRVRSDSWSRSDEDKSGRHRPKWEDGMYVFDGTQYKLQR